MEAASWAALHTPWLMGYRRTPPRLRPAQQAFGKPIHSYDLFVTPQATWYEELRRFEVEPDRPFLERYRQHIAPHQAHIEIHAGDLFEQSWNGQPIEILFLDICKSPALHDHATRLWFPRLIPGRSIVVQQDYGWRHYQWGNVMMEAFADHFTVLDDLPVAERCVSMHEGNYPASGGRADV